MKLGAGRLASVFFYISRLVHVPPPASTLQKTCRAGRKPLGRTLFFVGRCGTSTDKADPTGKGREANNTLRSDR